MHTTEAASGRRFGEDADGAERTVRGEFGAKPWRASVGITEGLGRDAPTRRADISLHVGLDPTHHMGDLSYQHTTDMRIASRCAVRAWIEQP